MRKRIISLILMTVMIITMLPIMSVSAATSINIGDYVQMGTYYGKPIIWRCVDIDENGPLMLSDKIICLKPFDAETSANSTTGSHSRSSDRDDGGSNYWADSNMRSWLNSSASAGNVEWLCGNPPSENYVWNGYNEYDQEAGFLSNFTATEKGAIKTVTQKSIVAYSEYANGIYTEGSERHISKGDIENVVGNYDNAYAEQVTDIVFLLDVKQVNKVYQNSNILGDGYYIGEPTQEAVDNSEYTSSSLATGEKWHYWLRSPDVDADYDDYYVRFVYSDGNFHNISADSNGIGVRPAFYLADNVHWQSGNGSETNPYVVDGNGTTGGGLQNNISSNKPVYSTDQQKVLDELKINTNELMQNISCGNHPIKGPSVTFLGKTFYLFEFDGKLNFNFKNLNVQAKVDADKKTIQFLIGYKIFSESANLGNQYNDSSHWSQSYNQVKSLYKGVTGKNVDTNKLWNQFSSIRGQLKEFDSDLLVSAKCKVAGFLELSYETGEAKFSEGGFLMEASIGGEFVGRVPAFPAAYVVLGLNSSLEGKIFVAYEEYISINSELNAALAANIGVGLGSKKAKIYLEGGLKGTLGAKMIAVSGSFKDYTSDFDPLTVTVKGDVYLKGSLCGFLNGEKNWPIGEPIQLYPQNEASLMSYDIFEEENFKEIIKNSTPLSREYLYNATLSSLDDSNKLYSDNSVYSYNAPVLTTFNDDVVLLWIDDLGTKNDANKTSLMYSIYNGETWSEEKEICETGTYNGSPIIYNNGENIHILWSKAKTVLGDDAGLEDLITDVELYYSCYTDGEFSDAILLTDNNLFEINYDIIESNGQVAIAWIENTDNNPYMTSGINNLYTRECINGVWQDKQLIKSDSQPIDEIKIHYSGDNLNCAYTLIDSNNLTNIYNNSDLLGTGSYLNYENGVLYYLADSKIMMYDIASKTAKETGLEGVNNFSIYNGNAYSLVSDGFKCELYESTKTDGVFADWKQVTEFDRYIRDYSVTTDELGEPVYALNLVEVDTESESVYGASELAVCRATEINALNVSAVYYDETVVKPSAVLPLSIDINNLGTTDIESVTIELSDSNGEVISSENMTVALAQGTQTTVVYNYTLPQELALHEITVKVTSSDEERDTEDNSIVTSIGYADIIISDVLVEKTEDGAVVKGTLTNSGYDDTTNVNIAVYDSSYPDEILATIECGDIAIDEIYNFTYTIPEKYLTLEDKMTMYGLSFKAESDSVEANYANNSEKIVFGELTDYTVSFIDGNLLLDIVSVSEFEDYTVSKDGYTFEGWYASPTFEEDTQITYIPENISGDIIAYAKWTEVESTPSETPEPTETTTPTETPTAEPTEQPTATPTVEPTEIPTEQPTETPTPAPVVDKSALTNAISNAKAINEEKYTESSYSALLAAIATAEDVLADENATAEDVENAKLAIETAISGLVEKSEPAEPTEQPTTTPTEVPTETPTEQPSEHPTTAPTEKPTETPTPSGESVPVIGDYNGKLAVSREVSGNTVTFTITAFDGDISDYADIKLFIAGYNSEFSPLEKLDVGVNKINGNTLKITAIIPDSKIYKFMLWDKNLSPIINVIKN